MLYLDNITEKSPLIAKTGKNEVSTGTRAVACCTNLKFNGQNRIL